MLMNAPMMIYLYIMFVRLLIAESQDEWDVTLKNNNNLTFKYSD